MEHNESSSLTIAAITGLLAQMCQTPANKKLEEQGIDPCAYRMQSDRSTI